MLPLNLKLDKNGLLYYDDDRILLHIPLNIDQREVNENKYYPSGFYRIPGTDEYIIKYCYTVYTRKEIETIKEMLMKLIDKQKEIPEIDFPIGYFKFGNKLAGQIIKYYPNGISFDNILNKEDIELLGKYYAHDEDNIHNLFLLFNDVLNLLYKMFENGIYYNDTNPGNIILNDNEAKLIDFDMHYINFDNKDLRLKNIMAGYCYLLKDVLTKFSLVDGVNREFNNFEEAKAFTKKLENNVRRGR